MLGGFVNSLLRKVTGEDASLLKAARDDPQLLQVIADPGLVRAVEEILRDKTNLEKYKGTPELLDSVLSVVSKVDALSGRAPSLVPHAGQPGHVQLVHKEVVARTAPPPAYDLEDKADMPWYAKDWEIGKHLAQKGFCIVRGSLSSDVRHQAIAEASQLKSTGGFKRLPKEVLSGFFGEHGSAWTRHLGDPTASAHPEEEALHAVDTHLGHLGFDLASCSEAFFGLRLEGRTLGRVHCSRRAEDQPSPPLKDPDEADEYLALFMRKKLKLVYFLGPGLATLAISTIEDDSQAFRTLVQPGTLLVLRCDVCRCALESKVSELSVSVEVDFLAEQTCGTLESVLDRVQPPRELHAWYVGRLQAIAENDAKEVPSEWIKLAKQTFFHPRQCIRVSEVSHNLPTTVHDATSWRCPFGAAALGGNDCIAEIPSSKWDMDVYYDPDPANVDDFKMYTRHMGALDGVRTLMDDRDFADFGIIPAEAGPIDSRHILLHDSAVQCFGQAGIGKQDTRGKDIGFFCGISGNEMYYQLLSREVKLGKFSYASMSNATTVNRLSWLFGSTGPSLAIDTEDSSGSAALDTATSYLREDRCHQALASGVSLVQHPFSLIVSCASGFLAKSGRGRAFDESSDGIVRSEGVVCLLLEVHERSAEDSGLNTEEGDTATARTLISGSALNSKGLSSSLTAPSGLAMKDVLERAFKDCLAFVRRLSWDWPSSYELGVDVLVVVCLLALPLLRVVEAVAESAAEVSRLGLVCKDFHGLLWQKEKEGQEDSVRRVHKQGRKMAGTGTKLLAPRVALGPYSRPQCLTRLNHACLHFLSAVDSPSTFLPGIPFADRLLAGAASSLDRLHLSVLRPDAQGSWPEILGSLHRCLASVTMVVQLRFLKLAGLRFPAASVDDLAGAVSACEVTLRELRLEFCETSNTGAEDEDGGVGAPEIQDQGMWEALDRTRNLEVLHISGLRTSSASCRGLAKFLGTHLKTLRRLELGRLTSSSLLFPPSTREAMNAAAAVAGMASSRHFISNVSPEMSELLALGKPLQLRSLTLSGLEPHPGLGPLAVGFGICAANLGALLEAAARLAPTLTELDFSANSAVAAQAMPITVPAPDGQTALLAVLECCGPLTKLDLSGSGICLARAASALSLHGSTLLELRISDCAIMPSVGPRGDMSGQQLARALETCDLLQHLDLGDLGMVPALRRPCQSLLQRCAPSLRSLVASMPPSILEAGLSSLFATGTCREGGARSLEELDLTLPVGFHHASRSSAACAGLPVLLSASAATLRRLRLQAPLGDALGSALVRSLRRAPLDSLSLNGCGLGANTARYLAASVADTTSTTLQPWPISYLSLSFNSFGGEAVVLLQALSGARRLRQLHLCSCDLSFDSVPALGCLLVRLPALEFLNAQTNPRLFGTKTPGAAPDGARALLEAALREFGRCQSTGPEWPTGSLPRGRVDFRGCNAVIPTDAAAGAGEDVPVPGRMLPPRLGRFELRWDGEANAGGSTLTDAVELGVLRTSFASPKEDVSDTVVLRSFKSVLGDSGAPSGLAGIARACVALAQAVHGPSLHLKQLFELGEEENDSWGSSSPASVLAGVRRLILPSEVRSSPQP
ncbi:unnamed protein product, partial [Polarella glacialis]